jgi:NDP-sugar pyrophosphorylase family protein
MQAFRTDAFFLDIGIPADLEKAQTLVPAQNRVK